MKHHDKCWDPMESCTCQLLYRIDELETRLTVLTAKVVTRHHITDEQIDAAWIYMEGHSDQYIKGKIEMAFRELGIERCDICNRCPGKQYEWGKGDELQPCANCNGHGWTKTNA